MPQPSQQAMVPIQPEPSTVVATFNRGEIDPKAIARLDITQIRNSGTLMTNWLPVRLGPMMFRPGFGQLGAIPNGAAHFTPFIHATNDVAALEWTNDQLRVWVDNNPIVRNAAASTISNGTFVASFAPWTNSSSGSGTATWLANSQVALTGDGTLPGAITYSGTFNAGDVGKEIGLRFVFAESPVVVTITDVASGTVYYTGQLLPGQHSLAITPIAASFTIVLANTALYRVVINSVTIEVPGDGVTTDASGAMILPTGITAANLASIRQTESVDVVFVCSANSPQLRIERRGTRSWSVVQYRCDDGPFQPVNNTPTTLTATALSGNTTLTASTNLFTSAWVGSLLELASASQTVNASASTANVQTGSVLIEGTGTNRNLQIVITGTFVATVSLQQSVDNVTWADLKTYTAPTTTVFNDTFDNSIIYYRLSVDSGNYTSGTVGMQLTLPTGSIIGVARILTYVDPTHVTVQVIKPFGDTKATANWYQGSWSPLLTYPSATCLFQGRLWFAGANVLWGSVSDAFTSFNGDTKNLGASASTQNVIAFGPADNINWLAATTVVLMGIASAEIAARADQFGSILTPTTINLRSSSTRGSALLESIVRDDSVYFIQRSGIKLFEIDYNIATDGYVSTDLNVINPSICSAGIVRMAVTREPETRVWIVLADGTMRVFLHDPAENIQSWSRIELNYGLITDVMVLPGALEDQVYITVNYGGVYHLQLLSLTNLAIGGATNNTFDGYLNFTSPGTTLSGLTHLEGQTVGVWADGQDRGNFTVSGTGTVTLPANTWSSVTAGIRYSAQYMSNKLCEYSRISPLSRNKRVDHIGLILQNLWPGSLQYGSDFNHLDNMPMIEYGQQVDETATISSYDTLPFEFNGTYDTDSRVCLNATGPCTVLSLVIQIDNPTGG